MNVQYDGLELNGDEYKDILVMNIVSGKKRLLLGNAKGNHQRRPFNSLSPDERKVLPDLITEVDLDGDTINELVVVSRERLFKTSDERSFIRVLQDSVYFGQANGSFRSVRFAEFNDEQKALLMENARTLLSPPEDDSADPSDFLSSQFY